MLVCGLAGDETHDVRLAETLRVQFSLEPSANLLVCDEDIGVVQCGEIECLAWRGADCAVVGDFP